MDGPFSWRYPGFFPHSEKFHDLNSVGGEFIRQKIILLFISLPYGEVKAIFFR